MHSHHIFLFPFRWNYFPGEAKSSDLLFSKRTSIEKFDSLKNPKWVELSDHLTSPVEFYNDATFFYDSIRPSVFNIQTVKIGQTRDAFGIVHNYVFDFEEASPQYIISTKEFGEFKLYLEKVRLNVYQTGVGVLSFHLANELYESPEDVLKINDFGRRFFPQFLDTEKEDLLDAPQSSVLPKKIEIVSKSGKEFFKEDFEEFQMVIGKSNIQKLITNQPNRLPNGSEKLVQAFLGDRFHLVAYEKNGEESIIVKPTLDDRLFGICWFGNDSASKLLTLNGKTKGYGFEKYKDSEFWMRFLFMEHGQSSCRSRLMRPQLMLNHTYHRWADYGTLYGSTRSTFVSLSDRSNDSKKFVLGSMRHSYFEMVQLVLVQHASIQRFSEEVTVLRTKEEQEQTTLFFAEAKSFYRKYLEFIDSLYFQDVSPLEQANELYQLQQDNLGVKLNMQKLELKMSEFDNLINRIEQQKIEKHNNWLTQLATWFLPMSLMAAIFGMSTMDKFQFWGREIHWEFLISLLVLLVFSAIIIWRLDILSKRMKL